MGRATSRKDGDSSNGDGDGQERRRVLDQGLVFRAADSAESHGFRALFSTEEDGALGAAAPFAGQVLGRSDMITRTSTHRIPCAAAVSALNLWCCKAGTGLSVQLDGLRLDSGDAREGGRLPTSWRHGSRRVDRNVS